MKVSVYTLVLSLMCTFANVVKAQNALDETIKKNVSIKSEIKKLEAEYAGLKNEIVKLDSMVSVDEVRLKSLQEEIEKRTALTSGDNIKKLHHDIDSLVQVHNSFQISISSMRTEIDNNSTVYSNKRLELEKMKEYSEIHKNQIYEENKRYFTKKFSQMDMSSLEEMTRVKEQFKEMGDYQDYQKRLSATVNNKRIYDRGWDCISKGIGNQYIDTMRNDLYALMKIEKDNRQKGLYKLTTEQYNEIDTLDIRLSRFFNGLKCLQEIVNNVNKDTEISQLRANKKDSEKGRCKTLMQKYILPGNTGSEQEKKYERYLKMIPYLEKLLKDYWNELQQNPFIYPTKSETIINNLKAK